MPTFSQLPSGTEPRQFDIEHFAVQDRIALQVADTFAHPVNQACRAQRSVPGFIRFPVCLPAAYTRLDTNSRENRVISRHIAALLGVSLLAGGCASVDKTALSTDSKKRITTVAVMSVPEPEKFFLNPGQAPGGAALYMFGAIGGLILGGIEASRAQAATNEFTDSIKPTNPDVAQHWNETILGLLQSRGYEVTQVPQLPMKADGKEFDCSSLAGKFDAVLLSSISPGYAVESGVEPHIVASIRLTSSNCTDTHFSDEFLYSARSLGKLTHIERDAKFTFPNRDALLANPQRARQALRTGLAEIAKRAASDL